MRTLNLTIEQTAKMYGVTVEAIKAQYLANIEGLERMHRKALETGKKVNGHKIDQLVKTIALFKEKIA